MRRTPATAHGRRPASATGVGPASRAARLAPVALFGPAERLRAFLAAQGLAACPVPDLRAETLAPHRALILAPDSVHAHTTLNRDLQAFAAGGGHVLILDQAVSPFPGLPLVPVTVRRLRIAARGHPLLHGLDDRDLAAWGRRRPGARPPLAYLKDDALHASFLLDAEEAPDGIGSGRFAALVEIEEGAGRLLACQLDLLGRMPRETGAAAFLIRLLRELVDPHPRTPPSPAVIVLGSAAHRREVVAMADVARGGATVLVQHPVPSVLGAYGRALGCPLVPLRLPGVCEAVRVGDDPLLNGVSDADTSGRARARCGGGCSGCGAVRDVTIGARFLAPAPGLEPLLVVAGVPAPAPVVLGRVRVGRGCILFNLFAPPRDADVRLARLPHRLGANLGQHFPGSPLDGPWIPGGVTAPAPAGVGAEAPAAARSRRPPGRGRATPRGSR